MRGVSHREGAKAEARGPKTEGWGGVLGDG